MSEYNAWFRCKNRARNVGDDMKIIDGGICAAKGFKANGIHCGIRKNKDKKDLALIYSEKLATTASVYTKNIVKGAPLIVTQQNCSNGYAQAIICNSGNANTCNANGLEIATGVCDLLAKEMNINPKDVIVASTGVIGQEMCIEPFKNGIPKLVKGLGDKSIEANHAIMTTDLIEKTIAVSFDIDGVECHIGGIAKGSGMINPNMATMLSFITTDVNISSQLLNKVLKEDILDSYNMINVDGDTSTNDMVSILANGCVDATIDENNLDIFKEALQMVTISLAKMIASDGEGATKTLICNTYNAKDKTTARKVAKGVICSNLFKAAMFGSDANWGRVLCAIGYSVDNVDIDKIDVLFSSIKGTILVCKNGKGVLFSEENAKEILQEKEITIGIDLKEGFEKATAFGCDLTYEYVRINGDYRS